MATNAYIEGKKHLVLKTHDVTAAWGKGSGCLKNIGLANRAFCIYFYAKQKVEANLMSANYNKMASSLENCLRTGYGWGDCDDLEEVFQHVLKNGGKYTNGKTESYNGGANKSHPVYVSNGPKGCVKFLKAVDAERTKLKTAAQKIAAETQTLRGMTKSGGPTADDHQKIKNQLKKVKDAADATQHLIWLVDVEVNTRVSSGLMDATSVDKITKYSKASGSVISKSLKFVDVLGKINDGLKAYDQTLKAGGSESTARAVAALNFTISYIPIISNFYGPIIQEIPGFISNMTRVIGSHAYSAENISSLKARSGGAQSPQCPKCGLSRTL